MICGSGMPETEQRRLAVLEDAPTDPNAPDPMADLPADSPTLRAGPMALLGTIHGVSFVSAQRLAELSSVAFSGRDEVFGTSSSWGMSYAIGGPVDWSNRSVIGMAGASLSLGRCGYQHRSDDRRHQERGVRRLRDGRSDR